MLSSVVQRVPSRSAPLPFRVPLRETTVALDAGTLRLTLLREEVPLDSLVRFACRRNPRRAFLFVSTILGRHLPIPPSTLRDTARRLVAGIPADLPGPILVVGFAEMAVALAQLVHDEYARATGRRDLVSLHSTRHVVGPHLGFEERHSHAAHHYLHLPTGAAERALFDTARTLLLVDDELTTGATAAALARAYRAHNPQVERVVVASPISFANEADIEASAELPTQMRSLVEARLDFVPDPAWQPGNMPAVDTAWRDHAGDLRRESARLGRQHPESLRPAVAAYADALAPRLHERILVVGMGEFCFEPFLLGEELVARGAQAFLQATSRSPVRIGHAMRSALEFPDAYGEGLVNFLYNATPSAYDRVVVFSELPLGAHPLPDLLRAAGGNVEAIAWNP